MATISDSKLFINCTFNASLSTLDANATVSQRFTTNVEVVATTLSFACVVLFVTLYFVRKPQQAHSLEAQALIRGQNAHKNARTNCRSRALAVCSWDQSPDIFLVICALAVLQGLAFFMSAADSFQPLEMSLDLCRAQGMLFQFATIGLNVAVVAETVNIYLVAVRSMSADTIRKKYIPGLVTFVLLVSAASVIAPICCEVAFSTSSLITVVQPRFHCYFYLSFL